MNNQKNVSEMLEAYHGCINYINVGCSKLGRELELLNQPLLYANTWIHHKGNKRIGVMFFDTKLDCYRWISVPVSVFNKGTFQSFAKKYCKNEK